MNDEDQAHCQICDTSIDDQGTEEEERAAAGGLCVSCWEHERSQGRQR